MQRLSSDLCIFCAFRSQSWHSLRSQIPRRRLAAFKAVRPFTDGCSRRSRYTRRPLMGESLDLKGAPRSPDGEGKLPLPALRSLILSRLRFLRSELSESSMFDSWKAERGRSGDPLDKFTASVSDALSASAAEKGKKRHRMLEKIVRAYLEGGVSAVDYQLKFAFYGFVASTRFTKSDLENQKILADLRYPAEWFPDTRELQRQIHLHVGPTNSGKTYHALKRLEQAETGVYAGPLRLLAHEVYTRLNNAGKKCLLITGEERRAPDEDFSVDMRSCTVEMVPLNTTLDVAVIDEIQMIASPDRGWAWTQAFLGLRAKELHLCGEERTVPLIRELVAIMGDKLEIHKYERLSPLKMMSESLKGRLNDLRKGDCVVSFSVMGIHALKKLIEKETGRKAAIIYGSLPPETRAQQARLFNDQSNEYDFLVASDAIGMGLNLSIKRIIFETVHKYDGFALNPLQVSEIKQIAGRAGRYRSADQAQSVATLDIAPPSAASTNASSAQPPNVGLVTTLEDADYPIVKAAMASDPEPITTAGILPPGTIVERFGSYFPPRTPFSYVLLRLQEIAQMNPRFHLCRLKDQLIIADAIQPVQGLTTTDRIIFSAAPLVSRDPASLTLFRAFACCVAEQREGSILDFPELPLEILDQPRTIERRHLQALETLHKGIILYLWLSYRFPGIFTTRLLAFHAKQLVEDQIEQVLKEISISRKARMHAHMRSFKVSLERESILSEYQTDSDVGSSQTDDADSVLAYDSPSSNGGLYERREPLSDLPFSDDLDDGSDQEIEATGGQAYRQTELDDALQMIDDQHATEDDHDDEDSATTQSDGSAGSHFTKKSTDSESETEGSRRMFDHQNLELNDFQTGAASIEASQKSTTPYPESAKGRPKSRTDHDTAKHRGTAQSLLSVTNFDSSSDARGSAQSTSS